LPASELEREILPARVEGYLPADLDRLISAGEVVWAGVEPLGERDGRVALYLTDHLHLLRPPENPAALENDLEARIVEYLHAAGASFFPALHAAVGGGFPQEVIDALWSLAWRGLVTNDALHALRAYVETPDRSRRRPATGFRSRRVTPPSAHGRWSLVEERLRGRPSATEWSTATARQLLARHGVLTREAMTIESVPGGYSAVYDVLRAMEDAGRVRRGLFVEGLGAAQFALPAALDILRSVRDPDETPLVVTLASTDPANPYGGILRWPAAPDGGRGATRSVGTRVVLVDGELTAWLSRGDRQMVVWLPEDEPSRSRAARALASELARLADAACGRQGLLVAEVNGASISGHPLESFLAEAGFVSGAMGMAKARRK
jgi:ATP-dependent helicase Lhr and Lhr-like helicase